MECPECKTEIGRANYCGCGWSGRNKPKGADDDDKPRAPCAHDNCTALAKVKIRTATGWANLCLMHYGDHYTRKANETCAKLNLHTTEQRREWAKAQLRANPLFRNLERLYQTEPGEDWTEPTS